MKRSISSKTLSFGMVSLPVKLYSATTNTALEFNMLSPQGNRVKQQLVDSVTGAAVERSATLKGYEYVKGQYVTLDPDALDRLNPEANRAIEIEKFVDINDVDTMLFDKTYYLGPDKGGETAYSLLATTLTNTKKVGVAKVIMSNKQHLVAIRARGCALTMTTLFYADELVDPQELDLPGEATDKALLSEAAKLVNGRTARFDVSAYHDDYREAVEAMIESMIATNSPAAPAIPDLMADLKASVAASRGTEAPSKPKRASRRVA